MATHNTNGTPLTLAVYVVGISGNCSKDYIGCGKSCLCRQFVHNEYVEESYSTLLQAEFDSSVIGQQHVIYWGQKEESYLASTSIEESKKSTKVKYEVFEHTLLYQDATGLPFSGKPYNHQIFTPLNRFLNKLSFKSRDLILSPELSPDEYEAKAFSYIYKVPIAYLYVVDVSQSCPVFMKQLELMNNLIKSVKKKKHHCVIVANKYDAHCRKNMENLEMWANALNIDVIQGSAKYDINIDSAFKYLAMKVFSRQLSKKFSINVQAYAEITVDKQKAISTEKSDNNSVYINTIPHISLANELSDSSQSSQAVHSLTSLAVAQEIKNGNSLSLESPSKASATCDDNDIYDLRCDSCTEEKPKIMEKRGTDISFNSDVDDDHAEEPEVEFPFRLKRSSSYRKAAFNSFKRNFIPKSRVPVRCSNSSLQESLVIVNDHVRTNSLTSSQCTGDHEHSQVSNGLSKKKLCSNPK